MFMPRRALNGRHPTTEIYKRGEDCTRRRMEAEEAMTGEEMALTYYGHPITAVYSFKYPGRVLSALDDDL